MLRAKLAHRQRTVQKGADLSDFATVVLDPTIAEELTAPIPFRSILGAYACQTVRLGEVDTGRRNELGQPDDQNVPSWRDGLPEPTRPPEPLAPESSRRLVVS